VVVESAGAPLPLPVAYRDDDLTLYRVGGERSDGEWVGGDHPAAAHRGVLIAAHLVWLAALIIGAVGMLAGRFRKRSRLDDAADHPAGEH
jgi:hypothetical protein